MDIDHLPLRFRMRGFGTPCEPKLPRGSQRPPRRSQRPEFMNSSIKSSTSAERMTKTTFPTPHTGPLPKSLLDKKLLMLMLLLQILELLVLFLTRWISDTDILMDFFSQFRKALSDGVTGADIARNLVRRCDQDQWG